MGLIVFKLGGSLLDLPDLPERIDTILEQRPGCDPLLVIGGGQSADIVRDWDRIHGLGEERAHWLAIRSLRLNETLVGELVAQTTFVSRLSEFRQARAQGLLPILDAEAFLRADEELPLPHLPHRWDVTSDSIAAWVATRWQAEELILLKSAELPSACTMRDAMELALVDRYFASAAGTIPAIGWANLRDNSPGILRWR